MCASIKSNDDGIEPNDTVVPTYAAQIYVGTWDRSKSKDVCYKCGDDADIDEEEDTWCGQDSFSITENLCQSYVDKVGLCVTVTRTNFIYTNGREPGFIIGLINYPRFPEKFDKIKHHAIVLARILKKLMQQRVSVVCSDETIMLGDEK